MSCFDDIKNLAFVEIEQISTFSLKTNDMLNLFCIFASIRKICTGRDKRTIT